METRSEGFNKKEQAIIENFVNCNVLANITKLVDELIELNVHNYEDLIYGIPDYEDCLFDNNYTMENYRWVYPDGQPSTFNKYESMDLCNAEGLDVRPYTPEVQYYIIVTSLLANNLVLQGEKVEYLSNNPVWCRTASGQEISVDLPITNICNQLGLLS